MLDIKLVCIEALFNRVNVCKVRGGCFLLCFCFCCCFGFSSCVFCFVLFFCLSFCFVFCLSFCFVLFVFVFVFFFLGGEELFLYCLLFGVFGLVWFVFLLNLRESQWNLFFRLGKVSNVSTGWCRGLIEQYEISSVVPAFQIKKNTLKDNYKSGRSFRSMDDDHIENFLPSEREL